MSKYRVIQIDYNRFKAEVQIDGRWESLPSEECTRQEWFSLDAAKNEIRWIRKHPDAAFMVVHEEEIT